MLANVQQGSTERRIGRHTKRHKETTSCSLVQIFSCLIRWSVRSYTDLHRYTPMRWSMFSQGQKYLESSKLGSGGVKSNQP